MAARLALLPLRRDVLQPTWVEILLSVARNAFLNLLGYVLPLAAALVLVPALAARLDAERFGFLALAWALVGYFALFDLGFGRTLSRLVAERQGTHRAATLPELTRTCIALTLLLGMGSGVLLFAAAGPICRSVLHVSPAVRGEALGAVRILALSLPLVTVTAALRGLLEAAHRFDVATSIRVPIGVLTLAAPLAVTATNGGLVAITWSLVLVRAAGALAHWSACRRLYPDLVALGWPRRSAVNEMLAYGAWLTVSNVLGPLMVYIDRFVIASLAPLTAVAYYSAPYEVVTRLAVVPAAIAGALFPAMAAGDAERTSSLLRMGVKLTFVVVFPFALAGAALAPEWLGGWFGTAYRIEGARAAQFLCFGVAANCLAYLPLTLLQARGHADVSAKLHSIELPFYLLLLWLFVTRWGIVGAAAVWALRCTVDAALMFALGRRRLAHGQYGFTVAPLLFIAFSLVFLVATLLPLPLAYRATFLFAVLLLLAVSGWYVFLDPSERRRARHPLSLLLGGRLQ